MNVINMCSTQKEKIRINYEVTEEFLVQKGARQGCPLSPILFTLAIEILLNKIPKDKQYSGIKVKNLCFKYRVCADDVVFFMEDPRIYEIIEIIEEFGIW